MARRPGAVGWFGGLAIVLALLHATPVVRAAEGGSAPVRGGVVFDYYQGQWSQIPDFGLLTPAGTALAGGFDLGAVPLASDFAVSYRGFLSLPAAGTYRFYTRSDDGSALFIDGVRVVDNGGLHAVATRWGSVALSAGVHAIRVDFFQRGGDRVLEAGYQSPSGVVAPIAADALSYDPDLLPPPREPDAPVGDIYAGLAYAYYQGDWSVLPAFDALTPLLEGTSEGLRLDERLRNDRYAFRYRGYLEVPEDGVYRFYLSSDDGSALSIGDRKVVDNDGLHSLGERGGVIALRAGVHRVEVDYFQKWGEGVLALEWSGPSFARTAIPAGRLTHTLDMLPPLKAPDVPAGPLAAGLAYRYYEGDFASIDAMQSATPRNYGATGTLGLERRARDDQFGFIYSGYIAVPEDGVYRFSTESDDGSRLWIGDTLVVDSDGAHAVKTVFGTIALKAGLHRIRVGYFERWGEQILRVAYRTPSGVQGEIPASALSHTQDQLPPLRAAVQPAQTTLPGLAYAYYEGDFAGFPSFDALSARAHGVAARIDPSPARRDFRFALRFDGYLSIREAGFYRLRLRTGGATRLFVGDTLAVENPGRSWQDYDGTIGLEAGLHPIRVEYYQGWGVQPFALTVETPGGVREALSGADLFHTASQLPALVPAVAPPAGARTGLAYRSYDGAWSTLPDFSVLESAGLGIVRGVGAEAASAGVSYGLRFEGYLRIPEDGFYDLYLRSDDGSRLWIGDALAVDNDGLHAARDAFGNLGLAAGWHPIRLDYMQRWGDAVLELSWRTPNGQRTAVPPDALALDPAGFPTLKAADAARDALVGGIGYAYYEGDWKQLPDFGALTPKATGSVPDFALSPRQRNDRYGFRFTGYIDIPEYGVYTFYTTSDDGSRLWIGDRLVVDNDGLHGVRERSGRIGLERGRHAIRVEYFERDGNDSLSVAYAGPHFARAPIAPAMLFRLDPAGNGSPGDPGQPEGPADPAANRAPRAGADAGSTGIGAGQTLSIDVLGNDSDPDGDLLLLAGASSAAAAGAALVDVAGGRLIYVPPLGFVGEDRVSYALSDRRGGLAQGELTVRVGAGANVRMSAAQAVRFLTQATFGPTRSGIAELMQSGPEAWIDAQLALPPTTHADAFAAVRGTGTAPGNRELRVRAWLDRAVNAPDQLRQRLAFALSQILVVSDAAPALATEVGELGAVDYYDLLVNGAFGRYRDLLGQVTLHPAMGLYLNMAGNLKADPVLGTVPDENYAREILQLFSIGLWQLAPDGERLQDGAGQPLPSYTQAEVMEFAKVFTGWDLAVASGADRYRLPMALDPAQHEDGPKTLLGGEPVAAGQGGAADLEQALDNIAAHPNLAPFISRQLIQRLVTSNPTRDYIGRVAAVFAQSGGDLAQTVKALLLDPEARTGTPDPLEARAAADPGFVPPGPAFGKPREPLLTLTALWRALGVRPESIRVRLAQVAPLGQLPLSAPTVFNFFKPDYRSPGEIADLGLYSPELEAVNEKQVIELAGAIDDWTLGATAHYDLTMESAFAASSAAKGLDHLDLLFMGGGMSEILRATLADELLGAVGGGPGYADDPARLERTLGAIYLILTSPEFQTQR